MKKFLKFGAVLAAVLALTCLVACSNKDNGPSTKYEWKGDNLNIGGVTGNYVLTAYDDGTWELKGDIPSLDWKGTGGKGTWKDNGDGTADIVVTHWADYGTGKLEKIPEEYQESQTCILTEQLITFEYEDATGVWVVTMTKDGAGASSTKLPL